VIRIGKTFRFEAAHVLPNHAGKCSRPHGHSYQVEVILAGYGLVAEAGASSEGMLMDFAVVAEAWKLIEDQLDHRNLNEQLPPQFHPTTAENIAGFLFAYFASELDDAPGAGPRGVHVEAVRVWETATGWAEVSR